MFWCTLEPFAQEGPHVMVCIKKELKYDLNASAYLHIASTLFYVCLKRKIRF